MSEANEPIDWKDVLRITNNKLDLAKEMVAMLGAELPHFVSQINQAMEDKDYPALSIHIHKLHGSCCYCGVPSLRALTQEIEILLKNGHHQDLTQKIQKLIAEIDAILTSMARQNIL